LLQRAVKKRLPSTNSKKIGLLFSGGVDSTIIALLLKRLGVEFTCYSAELISPQLEEAEDAQFSRSIANEYDLNLEFSTISIDELEELIIETMQIIETSDYIKVSVALPFLASCKLASTDSVDIMFSGLGSEEIFAGYRRHKQVENVNLECVKGLYSLHERDLYRDDVITMSQLQELRVPFLDKDLIAYCLQIPPQYKLDLKKIEEIKEDVYKHPYLNSLVRSKIILRDIGMNYLQLQEHFANRQKKAAQYGSKFDKGILRLAKNKGVSKQEYLNLLYKSLCDDNIS
jgi:asparagine synthase (glutamine-hydrolysing)